MSTKWLTGMLAVFMLACVMNVICLYSETEFLTSGQTSTLQSLIDGNIFTKIELFATKIVPFDYAFFREDTAGILTLLRWVFILCLGVPTVYGIYAAIRGFSA